MFARSLVSPHQARLLEERARSMRFAPTRSEERLWRELAGSRTGMAFRRQLVIGNFIVDFACTKLRLVVEIDGGAHEGRQRKDAARDRALAALGWRVLRFTESEVFSSLEAVVARIGVARTGVARTGVARIGVARTGVARTGVARIGVAAASARERP